MTDAALPVTERAVEQFAEAYLAALGGDIQKDGRRWSVSLPEDADTDLALDGATLVLTTDPEDVDDDAIVLAPESEFVERLLDEAAERWPVGALEFTGDTIDIQLPPWLEAGPVEIVDQSFTPYYDRRALCALFHVGIETVSEYQSEKLRVVAVDLNSHDRQPELARTYLKVAEMTGDSLMASSTPNSDVVRDALDAAHEAVEEDVTQIIGEVRERATRAAEVELEEYREYARKRRDELDTEIERLTERIEETTDTVETAPEQCERVEVLRKRKELRDERDGLRTERETLRSEMEAGVPERRREVRDRHALTVRIRPVALAGVSYERGDLDMSLRDGATTGDVSFAYAVGIGVTDEPHCDRCGVALTEENPLTITSGQLVGADCCRCNSLTRQK